MYTDLLLLSELPCFLLFPIIEKQSDVFYAFMNSSRASPSPSEIRAPVPHNTLHPSDLTPEVIQKFVRDIIAESEAAVGERIYRVNRPPRDRFIRVYADGTLRHFADASIMAQIADNSLSSLPILMTWYT